MTALSRHHGHPQPPLSGDERGRGAADGQAGDGLVKPRVDP